MLLRTFQNLKLNYNKESKPQEGQMPQLATLLCQLFQMKEEQKLKIPLLSLANKLPQNGTRLDFKLTNFLPLKCLCKSSSTDMMML